MAEKQRIEDILNDCLECVRVGRQTVEECLARYPEEAGELEPLLRLALSLDEASRVAPAPAFKEAARHRFEEAVRSREARRGAKQRAWWRPWAMAAAAMLAVAVLGSGTVVASAGSTPDQPLYPVKMAKEQVQLFLTRPPLERAKLNSALAEMRLQEIEVMADKGKLEQVSKLTDQLDRHLADMEDQRALPADQAEALRLLLETRAARQLLRLKTLEEQAPPAAKAVLDRALRLSETRFEKALRNAGVRPEQMDRIKGRWQRGLNEGAPATPAP